MLERTIVRALGAFISLVAFAFICGSLGPKFGVIAMLAMVGAAGAVIADRLWEQR